MTRPSNDTPATNEPRSTDTTGQRTGPVPMLGVANLGRRAAVQHGFTTRRGGVSEGPWGPLNLARRPGEPDAHLRQNWEAVARTLDERLDASCVALIQQVHGNRVLRVERPGGPLRTLGEADAAYTTEPGVLLAVRTADCVPVLIAGEHTVAVAHSGWRGTVAGVVPALVAALVDAGERPEDLSAGIGPAISGAVYEVGDEVVEGLRAAGLDDDDFLVPDAPGLHVDLRAAVAAQLRGLGVHDVETVAACTVRDPSLHSHRRDGPDAGRQAAVIVRFP